MTIKKLKSLETLATLLNLNAKYRLDYQLGF